MTQGELFGGVPSTGTKRKREAKAADRMTKDGRKLVRVLRAAEKGGLVNGMSKAQLRRYAPAKLPKVTI